MRELLGILSVVALLAGPAFAADPRDAAHRSLLEKDAGYARAVKEFDERGSNVEDWKKLAESATDPVLRTHATYFLGRSYLASDEFEHACDTFEKLRASDDSPWKDEVLLYLGYSYARRTDLDAAKESSYRARAKECLEALPESASERVRELARWLVKELSGEGSGPLLEIARRMETIEHAIDHEKTGHATQQQQEAVIAELDRLIERMREHEGTPPPKNRERGKKPQPVRDPRKPDGRYADGSDLDPRKPHGGWPLDLPEKERLPALQFIQEHFPARYRELVEQYMKSLAERTTK